MLRFGVYSKFFRSCVVKRSKSMYNTHDTCEPFLFIDNDNDKLNMLNHVHEDVEYVDSCDGDILHGKPMSLSFANGATVTMLDSKPISDTESSGKYATCALKYKRQTVVKHVFMNCNYEYATAPFKCKLTISHARDTCSQNNTDIKQFLQPIYQYANHGNLYCMNRGFHSSMNNFNGSLGADSSGMDPPTDSAKTKFEKWKATVDLDQLTESHLRLHQAHLKAIEVCSTCINLYVRGGGDCVQVYRPVY